MSALADVLQGPAGIKQDLALPAEERGGFEWRARWLMAAHDHQIQPPGDWWTIWLLLAGRGAPTLRAEIPWPAIRDNRLSRACCADDVVLHSVLSASGSFEPVYLR